MKVKLILLMVSLALFIEELRNFVEIGGLTNRLATSLAKLTIYTMIITLISLDYSTAGRIWSTVESALKMH